MTTGRLAARQRAFVAAGAALMVPFGLAVRALPGVVGDVAGGIAYVVFLATLAVVVMPRLRPGVAAVTAAVASCGVELLQLSPLPRGLATIVPGVRFVLGATFAWADLVAYAAGGAVAFAVISTVVRGVERRRT